MSEVKEIQITTKINQSELYEFIMHHNYVSARGVISVLFSLISLVGTIIYWTEFSTLQKVLMLFMSLMFTVITPIEYYIRAKKQIKKSFSDEITYLFNTAGITIKIKEQSSNLAWNEVMKVISTKSLVVIYFTPVRAFILPKKDINNKFDTLKDMLLEYTDCYKFKME